MGLRNVLVVHIHHNNGLCVKSCPSYIASLGNSAHLLDTMPDQRLRLSMVGHVVHERGLERGGTVDNHNTTRDCSLVIAVYMVMVRFKVPLPVLDGLSMLSHDSLEFDCNLDRRRSGAEDPHWWLRGS
jgi:hypothetical protein